MFGREARLSSALHGDLRRGRIPDVSLGGYLASLGATVIHERMSLPEWKMHGLSPEKQAARLAASARSRMEEIAQGCAAFVLARRNKSSSGRD
jgi:hypothetical protein